MDKNPDFGNSKELDRNAAEASVAWQAKHFPEVAVSLSNGGSGFLTVHDTWHADSAVLEAYLAYQTRFARGMDDRTKGAHLIAFYSHHLCVAAGALYLEAGLVVDLRPSHLALRFEPYDPPVSPGVSIDARRFCFRFSRSLVAGDSASAFHGVFVESLTPVIETLHLRTGLSPVAQWRLAADGLAGAFLEIGRAAGRQEEAMAAALAIVEREGSPLHSNTLRFTQVDGVSDGAPVSRIFRLRSGCCLYYRTEGGDFCDACVLLEEQTQKRRLRAHLERSDG